MQVHKTEILTESDLYTSLFGDYTSIPSISAPQPHNTPTHPNTSPQHHNETMAPTPIDPQLIIFALSHRGRNIQLIIHTIRHILTLQSTPITQPGVPTTMQWDTLHILTQTNLSNIARIIGLNQGPRRLCEDTFFLFEALIDHDPFFIDLFYILRTNNITTVGQFDKLLTASPIYHYLLRFDYSRFDLNFSSQTPTNGTPGTTEIINIKQLINIYSNDYNNANDTITPYCQPSDGKPSSNTHICDLSTILQPQNLHIVNSAPSVTDDPTDANTNSLHYHYNYTQHYYYSKFIHDLDIIDVNSHHTLENTIMYLHSPQYHRKMLYCIALKQLLSSNIDSLSLWLFPCIISEVSPPYITVQFHKNSDDTSENQNGSTPNASINSMIVDMSSSHDNTKLPSDIYTITRRQDISMRSFSTTFSKIFGSILTTIELSHDYVLLSLFIAWAKGIFHVGHNYFLSFLIGLNDVDSGENAGPTHKILTYYRGERIYHRNHSSENSNLTGILKNEEIIQYSDCLTQILPHIENIQDFTQFSQFIAPYYSQYATIESLLSPTCGNILYNDNILEKWFFSSFLSNVSQAVRIHSMLQKNTSVNFQVILKFFDIKTNRKSITESLEMPPEPRNTNELSRLISSTNNTSLTNTIHGRYINNKTIFNPDYFEERLSFLQNEYDHTRRIANMANVYNAVFLPDNPQSASRKNVDIHQLSFFSPQSSKATLYHQTNSPTLKTVTKYAKSMITQSQHNWFYTNTFLLNFYTTFFPLTIYAKLLQKRELLHQYSHNDDQSIFPPTSGSHSLILLLKTLKDEIVKLELCLDTIFEMIPLPMWYTDDDNAHIRDEERSFKNNYIIDFLYLAALHYHDEKLINFLINHNPEYNTGAVGTTNDSCVNSITHVIHTHYHATLFSTQKDGRKDVNPLDAYSMLSQQVMFQQILAVFIQHELLDFTTVTLHYLTYPDATSFIESIDPKMLYILNYAQTNTPGIAPTTNLLSLLVKRTPSVSAIQYLLQLGVILVDSDSNSSSEHIYDNIWVSVLSNSHVFRDDQITNILFKVSLKLQNNEQKSFNNAPLIEHTRHDSHQFISARLFYSLIPSQTNIFSFLWETVMTSSSTYQPHLSAPNLIYFFRVLFPRALHVVNINILAHIMLLLKQDDWNYLSRPAVICQLTDILKQYENIYQRSIALYSNYYTDIAHSNLPITLQQSFSDKAYHRNHIQYTTVSIHFNYFLQQQHYVMTKVRYNLSSALHLLIHPAIKLSLLSTYLIPLPNQNQKRSWRQFEPDNPFIHQFIRLSSILHFHSAWYYLVANNIDFMNIAGYNEPEVKALCVGDDIWSTLSHFSKQMTNIPSYIPPPHIIKPLPRKYYASLLDDLILALTNLPIVHFHRFDHTLEMGAILALPINAYLLDHMKDDVDIDDNIDDLRQFHPFPTTEPAIEDLDSMTIEGRGVGNFIELHCPSSGGLMHNVDFTANGVNDARQQLSSNEHQPKQKHKMFYVAPFTTLSDTTPLIPLHTKLLEMEQQRYIARHHYIEHDYQVKTAHVYTDGPSTTTVKFILSNCTDYDDQHLQQQFNLSNTKGCDQLLTFLHPFPHNDPYLQNELNIEVLFNRCIDTANMKLSFDIYNDKTSDINDLNSATNYPMLTPTANKEHTQQHTSVNLASMYIFNGYIFGDMTYHNVYFNQFQLENKPQNTRTDTAPYDPIQLSHIISIPENNIMQYFICAPQYNPTLEHLRHFLVCFPTIEQRDLRKLMGNSIQNGAYPIYTTLMHFGVQRGNQYIDEIGSLLCYNHTSLYHAHTLYHYHLMFSTLLHQVLLDQQVSFLDQHDVLLTHSFEKKEEPTMKKRPNITYAPHSTQTSLVLYRAILKQLAPNQLQEVIITDSTLHLSASPHAIASKIHLPIDNFVIESPLFQLLLEFRRISPSSHLYARLERMIYILAHQLTFTELLQNNTNNILIEFSIVQQQKNKLREKEKLEPQQGHREPEENLSNKHKLLLPLNLFNTCPYLSPMFRNIGSSEQAEFLGVPSSLLYRIYTIQHEITSWLAIQLNLIQVELYHIYFRSRHIYQYIQDPLDYVTVNSAQRSNNDHNGENKKEKKLKKEKKSKTRYLFNEESEDDEDDYALFPSTLAQSNVVTICPYIITHHYQLTMANITQTTKELQNIFDTLNSPLPAHLTRLFQTAHYRYPTLNLSPLLILHSITTPSLQDDTTLLSLALIYMYVCGDLCTFYTTTAQLSKERQGILARFNHYVVKLCEKYSEICYSHIIEGISAYLAQHNLSMKDTRTDTGDDTDIKAMLPSKEEIGKTVNRMVANILFVPPTPIPRRPLSSLVTTYINTSVMGPDSTKLATITMPLLLEKFFVLLRFIRSKTTLLASYQYYYTAYYLQFAHKRTINRSLVPTNLQQIAYLNSPTHVVYDAMNDVNLTSQMIFTLSSPCFIPYLHDMAQNKAIIVDKTEDHQDDYCDNTTPFFPPLVSPQPYTQNFFLIPPNTTLFLTQQRLQKKKDVAELLCGSEKQYDELEQYDTELIAKFDKISTKLRALFQTRLHIAHIMLPLDTNYLSYLVKNVLFSPSPKGQATRSDIVRWQLNNLHHDVNSLSTLLANLLHIFTSASILRLPSHHSYYQRALKHYVYGKFSTNTLTCIKIDHKSPKQKTADQDQKQSSSSLGAYLADPAFHMTREMFQPSFSASLHSSLNEKYHNNNSHKSGDSDEVSPIESVPKSYLITHTTQNTINTFPSFLLSPIKKIVKTTDSITPPQSSTDGNVSLPSDDPKHLVILYHPHLHKDKFGESLLSLFCRLSRDDVVPTLLQHGGWKQLTTKDRFGSTSLHNMIESLGLHPSDSVMANPSYVQKNMGTFQTLISKGIYDKEGINAIASTTNNQLSAADCMKLLTTTQLAPSYPPQSYHPLARNDLTQGEDRALFNILLYFALSFKYDVSGDKYGSPDDWSFEYMPALE